MRLKFEDALLFGQIGENWVSYKAGEAGFLVQKNSHEPVINGQGPRAHSADGASIPRPDFVFSKRGVSITAEIKTKDDRTTGYITGAEETGIDYQKWIDYRDYERATGCRVLLVNVEYIHLGKWLTANPRVRAQFEKTGSTTYRYPADAVLAQWLDCLKPSLNKVTDCYGKPMVYFAIAQFNADWLGMMEAAVKAGGRALL